MHDNTDRNVNSLIDELIAELHRLRLTVKHPTAPAQPRNPGPRCLNQVHDDLDAHPGSTRGDVAKRVRLHPRTVGKCTRALASEGLAVRVGDGRDSRWFLTETLDALTRPGPRGPDLPAGPHKPESSGPASRS